MRKNFILIFIFVITLFSQISFGQVNERNSDISNDSCKQPEINYFKIKEIIDVSEWYCDVVFEFEAVNTERFRLTHDCFDYGYSYDYFINDGSCTYTIHNVDKYYTNYFRLYAINLCGEESRSAEIVLAPSFFSSTKQNTANIFEIKFVDKNTLSILNPLHENLNIKVFHINGACVLSERLVYGINRFSVNSESSSFIVIIEKKGKVLLHRKLLM